MGWNELLRTAISSKSFWTALFGAPRYRAYRRAPPGAGRAELHAYLGSPMGEAPEYFRLQNSRFLKRVSSTAHLLSMSPPQGPLSWRLGTESRSILPAAM